MLQAIASRELPIPDFVDIFHLTEEMAAIEKTPIECVLEVRPSSVHEETLVVLIYLCSN